MRSASVDLILKFGLFASCFFLTSGSLYSDCDSNCRMRTCFVSVGTGGNPSVYWQLDSADCLDCVSAGTRCNNSIKPSGTCTTTGNPLQTKVGKSVAICSGFGGDILEATPFVGIGKWMSFGTNYTCQ